MSLKKLLVLPMAILAFAAVFAGPAAAAELHFLHNEEPIPAGPGPHLTFSGPASFENEAGGIACNEVHATVEFTTHDAHVTSFIVTGCETTGLLPVFGCELTGPNAPTATASGGMTLAETPWTVTPESISTANIAGVIIDNPMNAGCAFGSNITAKTTSTDKVSINAVSPGEFGAVTLTGQLETPIGVVNVEGALTPNVEGTITLRSI